MHPILLKVLQIINQQGGISYFSQGDFIIILISILMVAFF